MWNKLVLVACVFALLAVIAADLAGVELGGGSCCRSGTFTGLEVLG